MADHYAFLTYVRADDEANRGRLVQLAHDVAAEYEAITADSLEIVIDRDHLEWGDDWRAVLSEAVSRATFLIAFVTPRFFRSDECRREYELFQRAARNLGRQELVLPVLYIDVPEATEDSDDPLMAAIAAIHRADCREIRYEDRDSSAYRRKVNELAESLRRRMDALGDLVTPSDVLVQLDDAIEDDELDDAPGVLDLLEAGTGSPQQMRDAMESLAEGVNEVGSLMRAATDRLSTDENPKAAVANRVRVSAELADELDPVVEKMEREAARYREAVDRSTGVVDAFFMLGVEESNRDDAVSFARTLIGLESSAVESFQQTDGFIESIQGIENYSRRLRRPLQRLRRAVQSVRDTEPIVSAWADDSRRFLESVGESEDPLTDS